MEQQTGRMVTPSHPGVSRNSDSSSTQIKPAEQEIRPDIKEIKKRMQEVTVEGSIFKVSTSLSDVDLCLMPPGFRTLGIVSTFIAGVEAQCLGLTADGDINDRVVQAINALLLIGILLSAFGAVTSLLVARWFDLLVREDELRMLDYKWEAARPAVTKFDVALFSEKEQDTYEPFGSRPSIRQQIEGCTHRRKNKIVAKAAFIPLNMIAL
ncbi:hypothetical protein FRC12_015267 [Ceratobasidium sp. 428]|nr:hypothetical protein FRC12_015267 [Ceratobasidium sp. 428]